MERDEFATEPIFGLSYLDDGEVAAAEVAGNGGWIRTGGAGATADWIYTDI
ncbi:MAG: hypothetical protein KDA98_14195 [Acidimicrobiales bacterium]|nr:hypothetical protein [Acidimicrobiales bacterium]